MKRHKVKNSHADNQATLKEHSGTLRVPPWTLTLIIGVIM